VGLASARRAVELREVLSLGWHTLYNAQLARGDYLTHDGNPEACLMIC
jgi:hypothetical protein